MHKAWIKIGAEYARTEYANTFGAIPEHHTTFLNSLTSRKLQVFNRFIEAGKATNTLPDPTLVAKNQKELEWLTNFNQYQLWLTLKVVEGAFKAHMDNVGRGY